MKQNSIIQSDAIKNKDLKKIVSQDAFLNVTRMDNFDKINGNEVSNRPENGIFDTRFKA